MNILNSHTAGGMTLGKRVAMLLLLFAPLSQFVSAQTLNVKVGEVTYAHSAAKTGDMLFANGSTLTVQGKAYQLADVSQVTVDNSHVADNTVAVSYQGSAAQVTVAGNLAQYLTVTAVGADVSIIADSTYTEEITYTLTGTSTDGSFYMDGEGKASFTLDNLSLASAKGGAITIDDGKKINVNFVGTNVLSDATAGSQKACFYVNGHVDMTGNGTLTITGNFRHGYYSDEYTQIASGNVTVAGAKGDGFHVNQYFQIKGGTLTIASEGDGIDVGAKKKGGDNNGQLLLIGGEVSIVTTGGGSKALKADSTITMAGGTVTATSEGAAYYDAEASDIAGASVLKAGGKFVMQGGTLSLSATGAGAKGINADEAVEISDGSLTVVTTGEVYEYGSLDTKPHAVKTDGNIQVNGGKVFVAASSDGRSLSTDYSLLVNGGTLMAIGGKKCEPTGGTQGYKTYKAQVIKAGGTASYDGVTFNIPSNYNNAKAHVLVSMPGM
jgi:hypothetical protein